MEYDEKRANNWLTKLKEKVRYSVKMIKNTRYEKHVPKLASTRKRLTQELEKKYDPALPKSVLDWAKEIMRQVEAVRNVLARVIESSDRELPHTREAHQHAGNLVTEIGNGIREFEKTLTERE